MSAHGPPPTTRLVLAGHRQFMKRDGSGCWAGVRRLAIVTGLDKNTVAKHRALAVAAGWLIVSSPSPTSRYRTYLAAIPDGLPVPSSTKPMPPKNAERLSALTGQSPAPRLSAFSGPTVPPVHTHCLKPRDTTLVLTVNRTPRPDTPESNAPVAPGVGHVAETTPYLPGDDSPTENSAETLTDRLRRWLRTDGMAERYRGCYDVLIGTTPTELRFQGDEEVIRGNCGGATNPPDNGSLRARYRR